MLNWWERTLIVNAINGILDELFIEPTPENQEQIGGIIANYLEQEYTDMYDIFEIGEILEEVIQDE
jgi:hypothetical protein